MLGKAVLRHSNYRGWINDVILRFVECDSLWRTIDIYAFEVSVTLDDTLAGGIVGVWLVLLLTDIAAFVGGYESTYLNSQPVHFRAYSHLIM